jgi:putative ABC transport system permease protein
MKTPLAWLQLTHEKVRLLVALAGISFADILMFMQLGFRDALFDSAIVIHKKLNADIALISPQSEALHRMKTFSRRRLYQTLGIAEVASVTPVYLKGGDWKNPETQKIRTIMVIGFNPSQSIFNFPPLNQHINTIKLTDFLLFDTASRQQFGPIASQFEQEKIVITELNEHKVKVGNLFTLGPSFGIDGTVITSDLNFLRIFPQRNPEDIELGLIKLKPNIDPKIVADKLKANSPQDYRVLTYEELIAFEKGYWAKSSPIGFIFTLGATMGFVVGTIIVYQILYSDVSDHLPEYATLKAMGYGDYYLLIVVFQEALILAILGFLPGFAISFGLYGLTKAATRLPLIMELTRVIMVLILTVIMCFVSGAIAVRRLQDADPADIF